MSSWWVWLAVLPDLNRRLRPELASRVALAVKATVVAAGGLLATAALCWWLRCRALKQGRLWLARGFTLSTGLALAPVVAGTGFLGQMTVIEPNWLDVERVTIKSPALAPSFTGLTLVQITDLHVTDTIPWRVQQMVARINEIRPDAIFITGDFVSNRAGLAICLRALDQIRRPPYGIWAVPGNTDEIFFEAIELAEVCHQHGIGVLINERRKLAWGDRPAFCLAGVDDPTYGRDQLARTLEGLPVTIPVLLLAHSPSDRIVHQAAQRRVDLILVGHTHGGQVGIPWLRRLSPYADRTPYIAGLYQVGPKTQLYVNRGIGMKTRNWRLFCRPEITVLEVTD